VRPIHLWRHVTLAFRQRAGGRRNTQCPLGAVAAIAALTVIGVLSMTGVIVV
jgi:hypothetical protein